MTWSSFSIQAGVVSCQRCSQWGGSIGILIPEATLIKVEIKFSPSLINCFGQMHTHVPRDHLVKTGLDCKDFVQSASWPTGNKMSFPKTMVSLGKMGAANFARSLHNCTFHFFNSSAATGVAIICWYSIVFCIHKAGPRQVWLTSALMRLKLLLTSSVRSVILHSSGTNNTTGGIPAFISHFLYLYTGNGCQTALILMLYHCLWMLCYHQICCQMHCHVAGHIWYCRLGMFYYYTQSWQCSR